MSDYDRYLEPPSCRSTEKDETRNVTCGSCGVNADLEGTIYEADGNADFSATCPQCGFEIVIDIDLRAEAEWDYADAHEDEEF